MVFSAAGRGEDRTGISTLLGCSKKKQWKYATACFSSKPAGVAFAENCNIYNDHDDYDDSKDDNDDNDDDDDETVVTLAVIKQLIQMIQIKDTRRAPKYRNLPREYDQTRKLTTKPENSEPYKTVSPAFTNIYSSGQNSLCPVQVSHLHQALLIDTQGGNIKP